MMNLRFKALAKHTALLITSFFAVLFAVCFLSLSSNALAQTPGAAKLEKAEIPTPADFNVGDKWEWRREWKRRDNLDSHDEEKIIRELVDSNGVKRFSNGQETYQISNPFLGGLPDKPWRVWPLEVGKTWDFENNWTIFGNIGVNAKQKVKVVAYEEVVVPAGTFMAFKIEHQGTFLNSKNWGGKWNDTYWYAPIVKADVKRISDTRVYFHTTELISFKPGSGLLVHCHCCW